jgi:hypothetical protein
MLYAGLDLSRHQLDVQVMNEAGEPVQVTTAPPDADGLRGLARQTAGYGEPVAAATWVDERRPIESVRVACHVDTRWSHRPGQTSAAAAR